MSRRQSPLWSSLECPSLRCLRTDMSWSIKTLFRVIWYKGGATNWRWWGGGAKTSYITLKTLKFEKRRGCMSPQLLWWHLLWSTCRYSVWFHYILLTIRTLYTYWQASSVIDDNCTRKLNSNFVQWRRHEFVLARG